MNLVLGFIVVLLMTIPSDRLPSMTVAQFYENASTEATGLQAGDEILRVNGRSIWVDSDLIYTLSTDEGRGSGYGRPAGRGEGRALGRRLY